MPLVDFLVFVFAAVVILFFFTQVFLPLRNGMPMFPFFRHPGGELEKKLAEANEDVVIARTEQRVSERKEQAVRVRSRRTVSPRPPRTDSTDASEL